MQSGRVPMFKMRPQRGTLWLAIIVFLLGALAFYDGHRDPGDIAAQDRSNFALALSVMGSGVLMIVATSRMWFKHLWHDRYKSRRRRGSRS
jgi:hypothetical protein